MGNFLSWMLIDYLPVTPYVNLCKLSLSFCRKSCGKFYGKSCCECSLSGYDLLMYSSIHDIIIIVVVLALQHYQFVSYVCLPFDVDIYFLSKYHGIVICRVVTNRPEKLHNETAEVSSLIGIKFYRENTNKFGQSDRSFSRSFLRNLLDIL